MDGIAESTNSIFLGSTLSTTHLSAYLSVTTVSGSLNSAVATGTGNVTYTGAGHTTTHITASEHVISTWTSTADIYVDFDMKITSDAALASGKKYAIVTCAKFATANW